MISRTKHGYKITAYLPAPTPKRVGHSERAQIHVDFANLPDQPEAFQLFTRKWGPLDSSWEEYRHATKLRTRDSLRAAWRGVENSFTNPRAMQPTELLLQKNHFQIRTHDLMATLMILFLRDHWAGKTAICANPDCVTPYFIKKRKNQKYCEAGDCTAQAQREQKKRWWRENRGKEANE